MAMLKIELHRMTRAWYLWGILAVLFLGTNAYPIWCGSYTNPAVVVSDISKNIVGPLIASGIYMGLVHAEDLYTGLTRYWIASGISRSEILLARYLHSLAGSLLILAADSFLAVLVVNLAAGQPVIAGLQICLRMILYMLPFWAAMIALLQIAINFAARSGPNIALVVTIVFVLTAATNLLGREPEWQPIFGLTPLAWLMRCGAMAAQQLPAEQSYWLGAGLAVLSGVVLYGGTCFYLHNHWSKATAAL